MTLNTDAPQKRSRNVSRRTGQLFVSNVGYMKETIFFPSMIGIRRCFVVVLYCSESLYICAFCFKTTLQLTQFFTLKIQHNRE